MFKTLREDIRTIFSRDPAARSTLEILCCYPGLHALWGYRVAHFFWTHQYAVFRAARLHKSPVFSPVSKFIPAPKSASGLFIDHGMGVVIGETAEIGDDVLIYQGVVLGGTSLEKHKRHPTIGNRVVIGAAAIVLGPILIGDDARVGANSVVVNPVPAGKTVVGIPGKIVEDRRETIFNLEHGTLPDPINDALQAIISHQDKIEERLKKLETKSDK